MWKRNVPRSLHCVLWCIFACSVSLSPLLLFFFFKWLPHPKFLKAKQGERVWSWLITELTEVHWHSREGNTNAALCTTWVGASKFPSVALNTCQRIGKPVLCVSIQQRVISKRMCWTVLKVTVAGTGMNIDLIYHATIILKKILW